MEQAAQRPQFDPRQLGQAVGTANGPPKPLPLIDSAIARISLVSDRLSSMVGIVREYVDVTRGPDAPVPGNLGSPTVAQNSIPRGEVLHARLEQLETVTQNLHNQLSRLSGI